MDITQLDPQSALYVCRANYRNASAYDEFAQFMPADAQRVLDVGCGTGSLVFRLAGNARFIIGLDLSPTMIALARASQTQSGETNMAWVVASADALPFVAEKFDYVTSNLALRFSNLNQSLPELRRLVRSGGRIAIRDFVLEPRPSFWLTHLYAAFRLAPGLLGLYGWRGMFRVVRYSFSPAGIGQARQSRQMNAASFMEIYQHHFPENTQRIKLAPGTLVWENKSVNDH